jgi:RNA polymerase sigma factor (TIGR02999 family)
MSDVTLILSRIEEGDGKAAEQLLPLVYDELRRLAAQEMAREKPGQTLQPTALVHEAYLRLVDTQQPRKWETRRHFFSAAAEAMRRILVERARQKARQTGQGLAERVELNEDLAITVAPSVDLLALDEALAELAEHDSQAAELVKLRFFAGLTHQEAARSLGVSRRVADRCWRVARAWLFRALDRD